MKPVFFIVGCFATGMAVLGALLPGLPTTPFLLVALWAFSRSSRRVHDWLLTVPLLQTALREAKRFEAERTMLLEVKLFALLMAWGSFALTVYFANGELTWLVGVIGFAALTATVVTWVIPTARRS